MVTRENWDRCKVMLAEGASQRAIRAATGLARSTISRIDRGLIPRPSRCQGCKPRRPKRGRCGECGATVDLPCCACCPVMQPDLSVSADTDEPIKLELRGADRRRLDEVKAQQRRQHQRAQASSLTPDP